MASSMIAPTVATRMVQINPPSPRPIRLVRKPPTKAPAIPIRIVTIMPPGSSPGIINFASAPATSPIIIQTMIEPIIHPSFLKAAYAQTCTHKASCSKPFRRDLFGGKTRIPSGPNLSGDHRSGLCPDSSSPSPRCFVLGRVADVKVILVQLELVGVQNPRSEERRVGKE